MIWSGVILSWSLTGVMRLGKYIVNLLLTSFTLLVIRKITLLSTLVFMAAVGVK